MSPNGPTKFRFEIARQLYISTLQKLSILPTPQVDPKIRLDGQVIIVTGGNRGIGKGTVELLAKHGARVIIATCEVEQAKQVVAENQYSKIEIQFVDLASFDSVRSFAETVLANESRIDCLINNAAVIEGFYRETEDGIERAKQVNFLSPLLLTCLLLPLIEKSNGRVINMSSFGHLGIESMRVDDSDWWHKKENYDPVATYKTTKLAALLTTKYLSRKLSSRGIRVYAVDPGVAKSKLSDSMRTNIFEKAFLKTLYFFMRSPSKAAVSVVMAAVDTGDSYLAGEKYLMYYGVYINPSPLAMEESNAEVMWSHASSILDLQGV